VSANCRFIGKESKIVEHPARPQYAQHDVGYPQEQNLAMHFPEALLRKEQHA